MQRSYHLWYHGQPQADAVPYRIVVFAQGFAPVRRLKRQTTIALRQYAYMGWTPQQHYREARLPSAGSFLFPGLHAARTAAMVELAKPEVCSVSVRTNQDRKLYRFVKQPSGCITGYGQIGDC